MASASPDACPGDYVHPQAGPGRCKGRVVREAHLGLAAVWE